MTTGAAVRFAGGFVPFMNGPDQRRIRPVYPDMQQYEWVFFSYPGQSLNLVRYSVHLKK
jgi:hypothetical protein